MLRVVFQRRLVVPGAPLAPAAAAAAAARGQRHKANATKTALHGAVRPIPITIISVSRGKGGSAKLCASEWADKVERYTKLTQLTVKTNPMNTKDAQKAKDQEGTNVLKALSSGHRGGGTASASALPPGERLVVLDERGRAVSSEDMASLLVRASDEGWKGITFAIGGPFGHSKAVLEKADETISLSSCVLNHSIAHLVLMEQLYRAWTIVKGEPYHH